MTEERKHEIESIIDNALTAKDCKKWAAGNMTDNVSKMVKKYNIKQLNIWDDVCEIVEFYPETIKRESTWDYDDQNGKLTYDEYHVETIETWEWSESLGRYELVDLVEKDTGIAIPYDEEDYIRNGAVTIPTSEENLKEKYAVYDCDGNLKGYYVTDEELDDFAVESSSDAVCKHTELTRQLFCEKIGAQDLNYIDSGEYEITFKESRKEQVERETREFLCKVLVETYNIKPEKAPDYISEFLWIKTFLYASIDGIIMLIINSRR